MPVFTNVHYDLNKFKQQKIVRTIKKYFLNNLDE